MEQLVSIEANPIVHAEQRVITTELLAQIYETDVKNIQKNHERNKERFEEGKHYFKLQGEDLNNLRPTISHLQISPMTRSLMLWTERGASRHCKMLGTDMAWNRFDMLEECYFSNKKKKKLPTTFSESLRMLADAEEEKEQLLLEQAINKPRVEFAKTIEGTSEKILVGDLAKLTDGKIGRNRLFKMLRENGILMRGNMPYQKYLDQGYFEVTERVIKAVNKDIVSFTTYVTGKGQVWILNKINEWIN